MAFSFNPGQLAQQGGPTAAQAPGSATPGVPPVALSNTTTSTSPFYFIRNKGQPMAVMTALQIVLLLVSVLSVFICATLFVYSLYLTSNISEKRAAIDAREAEIPDYQYTDMKKLSDRLASMRLLLDSYVSSRSPLRLLESVVENQVYFDQFALNRDFNGNFSITFSAISGNYRSIIQQLEALNLKEYTKVATDPKPGQLIDQVTSLKVQVVSPLMVKGKLPEEIVFLDLSGASATISPESSSAVTAEEVKTSP